jgi:hypothetical protein
VTTHQVGRPVETATSPLSRALSLGDTGNFVLIQLVLTVFGVVVVTETWHSLDQLFRWAMWQLLH